MNPNGPNRKKPHPGRSAPAREGWGRPREADRGGERHGYPASPWKSRPPAVKPSKENLGMLLARYGIALSPAQLDQLWRYHGLLRENNKDLDLTRLIGFETMAQRHYADCMILDRFLHGHWPSPLLDVGTGAGFPGFMIKIMSPRTEIVLAEPRPRRVEFLEMVIREMKLPRISVFPHKVTSKSFTRPMAGCISRAFESVQKTLPRLGSALGIGGRALFMKGPGLEEELRDFHAGEYRIVLNKTYRIAETTLDRALLVLERARLGAAPQEEEDEDEEAMDGEGREEQGEDAAAEENREAEAGGETEAGREEA